MKRLYLLRHAQALPAEDGQKDIQRALSPQGHTDSEALGREIAKQGFILPDLIICSETRRTRETLEGVLHGLKAAPETTYSSALYDASCGEVFSLIQHMDDEVKTLMLIGHNPAIYELAAMLGTNTPGGPSLRLHQGYPPATLCALDVPAGLWANIDPEDTHLAALLSPIDYNAPERPTRWM
ncbi:MAG: histidine phosphatase family protein [Alphaproteobacteria bacterium]|nr:histidine phosphatase family protein [Alphaproteobacteria bacterium]